MMMIHTRTSSMSRLVAATLLASIPVVVRAFGIPATSTPRVMRLQQALNPAAVFTDDEWHPHDPAWTTPQLLGGIWDQIAHASSMTRGETYTIIYPQMQEEFTPRFLNLLISHLDSCKDVCDHFGITTTLVPYSDKGKITGFTAKSFRNPDNKDSEFEFGYDPFWDDGTDFNALYDGIDDEDLPDDPYPEIVNKVPADDEEIIDITKNWVDKIMSDMGICPFTAGPDKAGLPIGDVFYCVDRSTSFEEMYARYWKEVARLEQRDEKELSTTLLIAPEFCLDNVELFETFTNTLTQPLAALDIEDLIQLVFFHPHWSFRDGSARAGQGQAANYARRSPWPMINILRTSQVRAAQKGIPTGLVYKQNEKTLSSIGVDKLETMLRLRDWSDIADLKVNRREFDALKIAQDFQSTGVVKQQDQSLAHDATPAANKVDRRQVEQGNLVNVIVQALEKRLGKGEDAVGIAPLSGPETSATAMAADFLLQELERIAAGGGEEVEIESDAAAGVATHVSTEKAKVTERAGTEKGATNQKQTEPVKDESSVKAGDKTVEEGEKDSGIQAKAGKEDREYEETDELKKAKERKMEEARKALFDDLREAEQKTQRPTIGPDEMTDVLFGKGGIKQRNGDDEVFPEGMDHRGLL